MSLEDLDDLLHATLQRARPFAQTIFTEPWTAGEVQEFVNRVGSATAATVGPTGWPHTAWVPAACIDGTIYLVGSPGSVFLRNLEHDSKLAFSVTGDGQGIFGQGHGQPVAVTSRLLEVFGRLGQPEGGSATEAGWQFQVVELRPRRLFTG
jgi:hypothetical protein